MGQLVPPRIDDVTAAIKAKLIRGDDRSRVLGRYEIVGVLGSGAQGIVYEGRDPVLERKVAIKVLRAKKALHGRDPHARLRREARVLAQLDHPNIVRVFDVGTHESEGDREIHVVMEFVDGISLSRWLGEERTVPEILDMFSAVARGLAVAHRAGIVHRDFKPGNVLIGADGEPRVADFGLATVEEVAVLPDGIEPARLSRDNDLTLTGDVLGTPRYMPPEQLRGEPIGPSADQYAWCVALYRALWGEEPFGGFTLGELIAAKVDGPRRPPDRRAVPRGVWPVLERGMAADPDARHEGLDALLAALARARSARPGVGWGLVAFGGVALVGVALLVRLGAGGACDDARDLDVWTEEDRQAWRASPAGAEATDDDDPFAAQMDVYRRDFDDTIAELCRDDAHDEAARAAALGCLRSHRDQARSLLHDVARLPAELGPFTELAGTLRLPRACLDPHYRATSTLDTLARDATREYEAMSYVRLGRIDDARAIARAILREEDGLEREPVAWAVLGAAAEAEGDLVEADAWFQPTYYRAASLANHAGAANAAAHLVGIHIGLGRADQVEFWVRNAETALGRIGGDPTIESILQNNLGEAAWWRGDWAAARDHYRRGADVLEAVRGPDAEPVQAMRNNEALALERTGDLERALALHERLLAIRRGRHGGSHIDVYVSALNLGNLLFRLGALEEARKHCRTALSAAIGSLGDESVQADTARLTLAQIDLALGDARVAEAEALLGEVRPGAGTLLEEGLVAMQREFLSGWQARQRGDLVTAAVALERAAALAATHLGSEHPLAREVEVERAVIAVASGDEDAGLARLHGLVTAVTGDDASTRIDRGLVLARLGEALVASGRSDEAVPVLAEATELLGASWVQSRHAEDAAQLLARAQTRID